MSELLSKSKLFQQQYLEAESWVSNCATYAYIEYPFTDITCRADVPNVRHAVDYRISRTKSGLTRQLGHSYTSPMVGDEIAYICEDGYQLLGTPPVCAPNLQFTGFTTKCIGI